MKLNIFLRYISSRLQRYQDKVLANGGLAHAECFANWKQTATEAAA